MPEVMEAIGKLLEQEPLVDCRIGGAQSKVLGLAAGLGIKRQLFVKTGRVEKDALAFHIQPDAREAFGHLGIHVLVEADLGQLWPEGDVQAQCQFQSRVNVRVGQNAHSRREEVASISNLFPNATGSVLRCWM